MTVLLITVLSSVVGLLAALLLRGRASGGIALGAGLAALGGSGLLVGFC